MGFYWILSDSKSPEVSRTSLRILADLNNAVVWMVSNHPLISRSSSLFTSPKVTVRITPITSGITFIFHSCFFFLSVFKRIFHIDLSFRVLSILLSGQQERQSSRYRSFSFFFFFFFFFCWLSLGLFCLSEIVYSICISKSQRRLCISLFCRGSGPCLYNLFLLSNFVFLHNSQWITLLLLLLLLFTPLGFFTTALADGFPLEFEWQHISSSLQDSSQYYGCSQ